MCGVLCGMGRKDPTAAVTATGGAGTPGSVTCGMGRELPPAAVDATESGGTCDMEREDAPTAVGTAGGARTPGSLRGVVQVSTTPARVLPATATVATAAVTVAGATSSFIVFTAAATDAIAAATESDNATGAAALPQRAARELGSHNTEPEDGDILQGQTRGLWGGIATKRAELHYGEVRVHLDLSLIHI